MADTKISALTALAATDIATDDEMAIVDTSATASKKIDVADLVTYLQARGMPRVKRTAIHTIASTTGTEVLDLNMTLEAGTYAFDYYLIVRSATGTVGPMMGVNFTGTAAVKTMIAYWADATSAITAEVHSMDDQGTLAFGYISGMANKAYTTTAPNMGTTVGVSTTGSDIPMRITGSVIVTVAGDLELWHSSETATSTSVEAGSSLVVVRTA
jgi:hypothetical protein